MTDFLDGLRLATIAFLVGSALIIVGYVTHGVSFDSAFDDFLKLGVACGVIGYVRNGAGKGLKAARKR